MGKRKRRVEKEEFFKVSGIPGVSDSVIRKVLDRLHNERDADNQQCIPGCHVKTRFPELQHFVKEHDCGLATLDLQKYIDKAFEVRPEFLELFLSTVLATQQRTGAVQAVVYCDEAVPGNILAPDNRRRSYCFYFCWLDICKYRNDTFWIPFGLVRADNVNACAGGLPAIFSIVLEELTLTLATLVIDKVLLNTDKFYFLADEDALKKCGSHKGASGLRPCIKCANCISKGNEVAAYYSISETCWNNFRAATDCEVQDVLKYLQNLHDNAGQGVFEEAQTLSGWKYVPQMWALKNPLWAVLRPSDFVYDMMHSYFSNGIVGQELGLFLEAALTKTPLTRQDLEQAIVACNWKAASSLLRGVCVKRLLHSKLFKAGVDYKGDAGQTLSLLPLMAYVATTSLIGFDALKKNVDSLVALNVVVMCILTSKQTADSAVQLIPLQETHLVCFQEAYGPSSTRPKHHYSFHAMEQVLSQGLLLDTFPTERKHKLFKNALAEQIKRLHRFERSVLLRWVEADLDRSGMMLPQKALLQPLRQQPFSNVEISRGLQHDLGKFENGDVLLFGESITAFLFLAGCRCETSGFSLVLQALEHMESGPHFSWSKWKVTQHFTTMPLDAAVNHVRTSWYSVDAAEQTLLLLR